MPAFRYRALDAAGRLRRGTLQADTARGVRTQLRGRSLSALDIHEVGDADDGARGDLRLHARERLFMTRQLAILVRAGLPLDEALEALADGAGSRLRGVVMALRARVMEGVPLASAMDEFAGTFDRLYRASVRAGEHSGRLAEVLLRLAVHLEKRDALQRRLIGALAYPALLLLVALLVVCGLMFYVVPEVTAIFVRSGQVLPLPTRALLAASGGLQAHAAWLGPALLLGAIAGAIAWRRPAVRRWCDRRMLKLPLLGRLAMALDAARFARTLSMLGASAVPLLDALQLATQGLRNTAMHASLAEVAVRVRAGAPLSRALRQHAHFPSVATRMIANGERAGRVDAMLDEAAIQLENDLDTAISVGMSALGPVVILLVGALVLFIVLAMLLPIFEMNQLVA